MSTESEIESEYPIRGGTFVGRVISTKMDKSATVRWEHAEKIPKFERYERRNTKITVHVPEGVELEEDDQVKVGETKPISKTKSHVVMKVFDDEEEVQEEE
jgi:small subunit ribosomal protein S17